MKPIIDYTKVIKHWNKRARPIQYIVLHNTAGKIESSLAWFENPNSKVSAHYIIDRLGNIYKCVEENHAAWACGNSNMNHRSISIELEATQEIRGLTSEQEKSLLDLMQKLMLKYDIPVYNLELHRWIKTSTSCPVLIWEHDDDFIRWRQRNIG